MLKRAAGKALQADLGEHRAENPACRAKGWIFEQWDMIRTAGPAAVRLPYFKISGEGSFYGLWVGGSPPLKDCVRTYAADSMAGWRVVLRKWSGQPGAGEWIPAAR